MCSPREPEVFNQPGIPSASSSSRTQRATSRTREKGASAIGSRSMAAKSISCGDCARENQGSWEITASCTMCSSVASSPPTRRAGTSSPMSTRSLRTPRGTGSGARC